MISFDEFASGFRDFLSPNAVEEDEVVDEEGGAGRRRWLRRQSSAWKQLTQRVGEDQLRRTLLNRWAVGRAVALRRISPLPSERNEAQRRTICWRSAERLYSLYSELHRDEMVGPELVDRCEQLIEGLVCDVNLFEQERQSFERRLRQERQQHQERFQSIEDELETQVLEPRNPPG